MLFNIQKVLFILLVANITGYILVVLKEKIYLRSNIIVINNKTVTEKHLEKADMKEFIFDGAKVKSGDEVKIITTAKEKIQGILIGAIRKERSILIVTYDNQIKEFNVDTISKFKIISKYGRFFKA